MVMDLDADSTVVTMKGPRRSVYFACLAELQFHFFIIEFDHFSLAFDLLLRAEFLDDDAWISESTDDMGCVSDQK